MPPKKGTDVHPLFLMINQIAIGKTTHGRNQHDRATRHEDVRLCLVGVCAFFAKCRFHCTGEFASMNAEDWLNNKPTRLGLT